MNSNLVLKLSETSETPLPQDMLYAVYIVFFDGFRIGIIKYFKDTKGLILYPETEIDNELKKLIFEAMKSWYKDVDHMEIVF